ncbi:MAG: endonuclease III domain-containing protein [Desulfohalobiaceae bacterium]
MARQDFLLQMYEAMYNALGPSHWWPGHSSLEVCLGAILTQNTNWANVEKALQNLKKNDLLQADKLLQLSLQELAELIRPAGYFRIKAARLQNFLHFLRQQANLNLQDLAQENLQILRSKILAVRGIGPETADSILLYALHKPVFVVDAYTRRILSRHALVPEDASYQELQDYFMDALPDEVALYNEYHALLVRTGKNWCKKRQAHCGQCPLQPFLEQFWV